MQVNAVIQCGFLKRNCRLPYTDGGEEERSGRAVRRHSLQRVSRKQTGALGVKAAADGRQIRRICLLGLWVVKRKDWFHLLRDGGAQRPPSKHQQLRLLYLLYGGCETRGQVWAREGHRVICTQTDGL